MAKRESKPGKSPKPAPAKPARQRKAAVVSSLDEPVQNGQPASEEAIRLIAYQKWEAAGKPPGEEARFWLEAEQEAGKGK
jgi:hypothetical protein